MVFKTNFVQALPNTIVRQPKTERMLAVASFVSWATTNIHYKNLWSTASKEAKTIVQEAVTGMRTLTPFAWNHWWALNHMKHYKVTGKEQRMVNELLVKWLGEVSSGRLRITAPTTTQSS